MAYEDGLGQLLDGVVAKGYEWSGAGPVDFGQTPMHGYVHQAQDGAIEFEAIDEDPLTRHGDPSRRTAPAAVALSTPLGGAVLVDVRPTVGFNLQFGAARESVIRLRSDTLLFGVDIGALDSLLMRGVSARFEGLGAWAGLRSLRSSPSTDSAGRLTGLNVTVGGAGGGSRQDAARRLPGSLRLALDEHWAYRDTDDGGLNISTALEVDVSAGRPRPFAEYLEPVLDVQDLLSAMYRGFVAGSPGRVALHRYLGDESPVFWNRIAMHRNPRSIARPKRKHPLFSATQIGGVEGVARWVNLCAEHRAAVDAVVAVYREGPESASATVLRVGAAIEQYVGAHARSAKWASRKAATSFELALANHVAKAEFAVWSGDPEKWADRLHVHYLGAKHHLPRTSDPAELDLFARGARWLLLAALLDRVATTKLPSRRVFASGQNEALGRLTRVALGLPK